MPFNHLPPERLPTVTELRATFEGALSRLNLFHRLFNQIEEQPRHNDKMAEAQQLVRDVDAAAARALMLSADLRNIGDRFDDWQRHMIVVLKMLVEATDLVEAPDRVQTLIDRDRPHPNSVMGRPVPRVTEPQQNQLRSTPQAAPEQFHAQDDDTAAPFLT